MPNRIGSIAAPVAACLLFTLAPVEAARAQTGETPASEGLVPLKSARIDAVYVRPGVDWKKYRTILLLPLNVPPEARDGAPAGTTKRLGESYILRDSDVDVIKQRFDKTMRKELTRDNYFTLVDTPRADTLVVAVAILQIALNAPIESSRLNYANRGRTFSRGGGGATIGTAFADGGDYSVLARIQDNRYSPDQWGVNNSVNNLADLDLMFSQWGRGIRDKLRDIQAGKTSLP